MDTIDHLICTGLNKNEAVVLIELSKIKDATTPELENRLGMERRSVGKALDELERLGIITARLDQADGKGRPAMIWSMGDLGAWLDRRESEEKDKMENNKEKIEKLRRYIASK